MMPQSPASQSVLVFFVSHDDDRLHGHRAEADQSGDDPAGDDGSQHVCEVSEHQWMIPGAMLQARIAGFAAMNRPNRSARCILIDMLRWTFNILSMASLTACMATIVMWVESYRVEPGHYGFQVEDGEMMYIHLEKFNPVAEEIRVDLIVLKYEQMPYRSLSITVSSPCWFVALVTAILPTCWLARRKQRANWLRQHNRCTEWGYDLRASSDTCPECGTKRPISS